MILIIRRYKSYQGIPVTNTEFKVFQDDDIDSVQEYLDENEGDFEFKKL